MIEVLEFAFRSHWHFLGVFLLWTVFLQALIGVAAAFRRESD